MPEGESGKNCVGVALLREEMEVNTEGKREKKAE